MAKAQPIKISGVIDRATCDKEGEWKLTLVIPRGDGPKVAALSLHSETVFEVAFTVDPDSIGGGSGNPPL